MSRHVLFVFLADGGNEAVEELFERVQGSRNGLLGQVHLKTRLVMSWKVMCHASCVMCHINVAEIIESAQYKTNTTGRTISTAPKLNR